MTWDGVRRRLMRAGGVAQLVVLAAVASLWALGGRLLRRGTAPN